jgi:hypothetical protein
MRRPEVHLIESKVFETAAEAKKYAEEKGLTIYGVWRQYMKHQYYNLYRTVDGLPPFEYPNGKRNLKKQKP